VHMLRFAAAIAAIAPCAAVSEAPGNTTIALTEANAAFNAWYDAGLQLQLALVMADARLLPLAGEMYFALTFCIVYFFILSAVAATLLIFIHWFAPSFMCQRSCFIMLVFAGASLASFAAYASALCGACSSPICFPCS
jgi:hypothetical protein